MLGSTDFRVLGPLAVQDGYRVVRLGGYRQQLVLAVLLLDANRELSTDWLIDAVWGGEPPRTARKTLQACVSRLRSSLGEATIVANHSGYTLRAAKRLSSRGAWTSAMTGTCWQQQRGRRLDGAERNGRLREPLRFWNDHRRLRRYGRCLRLRGAQLDIERWKGSRSFGGSSASVADHMVHDFDRAGTP